MLCKENFNADLSHWASSILFDHFHHPCQPLTVVMHIRILGFTSLMLVIVSPSHKFSYVSILGAILHVQGVHLYAKRG